MKKQYQTPFVQVYPITRRDVIMTSNVQGSIRGNVSEGGALAPDHYDDFEDEY